MNNTALLIIDFINDIVHPEGKIAGPAAYVKANHVMEHANTAIAFARQNEIPIVMIKVGFSAHYLECPKNSPVFGKAEQFQALKLGYWGTEFHEALKVESQDFVVIKHRVSAFYGTSLEAFLNANQIKTLLLCGVSTDMTIQSTAREAHDRDYKVIVIADACGAGSEELHLCGLKLLQKISLIIKASELNESMV